MKGKTVVDAAAEWVNGFNAVQHGMIEALMKAHLDDWNELTTPNYGDRVCVWDGENDGQYGVIVEDRYDKEPDLHRIEFDKKELGDAILAEDEFEVERDSLLPMWGWLWSFGNSADEYWLEELGGIRLMSECGFRIYEHEEWGYFFGIDGAGYSFMDEHWEPLYRARGLQWHDVKAEHKCQMLKKGIQER
jgi:hypothetical protein